MCKLGYVVLPVVILGLAPTWVLADDKAKLDGRYTVVSGERDGKAMTEKDLDGCIVAVSAEKIIGTNKSGTEFLNCTFTLDQSKKPYPITLKGTGSNEGKTYAGLAERTADGFRIVYHMDGGQPPTEFKTAEKQVLLVLKLEK